MTEEEYIYVTNKTNLLRALDALRDCLPGYGYTEDDDREARKIIAKAKDRCFEWINKRGLDVLE